MSDHAATQNSSTDLRSSPRSLRHSIGLALLALPALLVAVPTSAATIGSAATNADMPILIGAWTTLRRINVPANADILYCAVTGSADFGMPAAGAGSYLATLTLDTAAPPINQGQERTVEFVPGGPTIKEVSTTHGFILAAGVAHSLRWLGRPAPGTPATVALDRSMTVVCDKETLGISASNPED